MRNNNLNDVTRMFIHEVMFNAGIVPMEDPRMDVRRALEGLSAEEARALKRKFRKLWRKEAKKNPGLKPGADVKNKQPSRAEKLHRKQIVSKVLWEQHITPMLKQFKSLEDTRRKEEAIQR